MKKLRLLAWLSAMLSVVVFWTTRSPTTFRSGTGLMLDRAWLADAAPSLTPLQHHRAPDQTFLTYPEWFLVFGPAEHAEYLRHHTSTGFPFMAHVFQAWESYAVVDDQTRGVFPANDEYHTMIQVINTSSTLEFGLKSMYESIIGRMTDVDGGRVATAEDEFSADFAQEYVTFLDTAPWYEFDFLAQLRRLWAEEPWSGPHLLRKWERRWFLTSEMLVKAAYGRVIEAAAHSSFERPILLTAVVLERQPPKPIPGIQELQPLTALPDGPVLAMLPRYTPFTPLAQELAKAGVPFQEIAGNRSAILITALGASDWYPAANTGSSRVLFSQPLVTKPGQSRWVLVSLVGSLHQALRDLKDSGLHVEHVFDY